MKNKENMKPEVKSKSIKQLVREVSPLLAEADERHLLSFYMECSNRFGHFKTSALNTKIHTGFSESYILRTNVCFKAYGILDWRVAFNTSGRPHSEYQFNRTRLEELASQGVLLAHGIKDAVNDAISGGKAKERFAYELASEYTPLGKVQWNLIRVALTDCHAKNTLSKAAILNEVKALLGAYFTDSLGEVILPTREGLGNPSQSESKPSQSESKPSPWEVGSSYVAGVHNEADSEQHQNQEQKQVHRRIEPRAGVTSPALPSYSTTGDLPKSTGVLAPSTLRTIAKREARMARMRARAGKSATPLPTTPKPVPAVPVARTCLTTVCDFCRTNLCEQGNILCAECGG